MNKLPAPPTPLVGRQREVAQVCALLVAPEVRILTLTGPGGSGKTRVAIAVAGEVGPSFDDGVVFVDLAPLGDAQLVPSAIADALAVPTPEAEPPMSALADALRGRQLLLLLDNFEQVQAAATEVGNLLSACPGLKILVTSRSPLHIYGESEFLVLPLTTPEPDSLQRPGDFARTEAVVLFLQRARAVRPDFQLTPGNAAAVGEICRRLDGLPLAIELAAARVKLLTPQALLERISAATGGLPILDGGPRDRPARQQTLRASLDWSYELLSPDERRAFEELSVFAGGFTLEAAENVVGIAPAPTEPLERGTPGPEMASTAVLDLLASLIDKSLLRPAERGQGMRFVMLETIREYVSEKLEATTRAEPTRTRHAQYFLALAEEAGPGLRGPEQPIWLARLEPEHHNLRAALRWALETELVDVAIRLGAALWRFWWALGHLAEGRRWMEGLLRSEMALSAALRSRALSGSGAMAQHTFSTSPEDRERAQTFFDQSLALFRDLGDARGVALSLGNLGQMAVTQGDVARGLSLLEESLSILRELEDRERIGAALYNLGCALRRTGDHERSMAALGASLALQRERGDRLACSATLAELGQAALDRGRHEAARAQLAEALVLSRELGPSPTVVEALQGMGRVAGALAQPLHAARLFGAAAALREGMGLPVQDEQLGPSGRGTEPVRAMLDEPTFVRAWTEGRALSFEQAVDLALAVAPPGRSAARALGSTADASPLSSREAEVAILIARGLSNREVAAALVIAEGTAERHVANILKKLALSSRAQVAVWAVGRGLLPSRPRS